MSARLNWGGVTVEIAGQTHTLVQSIVREGVLTVSSTGTVLHQQAGVTAVEMEPGDPMHARIKFDDGTEALVTRPARRRGCGCGS